jgi:hypothetical protein
MKIIKLYNSFVNEKYEENPDFRIKSFFDELSKNIREWFTNGTFAANGAELSDIKISTLNDIDKNLIFDFTDKEFYYQVFVIISIQEVDKEQLEDCYIKVKKYDDEGKLIRMMGKDLKVKDIDEDKIVQLFSDMDEKSASVLDGSPETLSDEDTNLEDTSIV